MYKGLKIPAMLMLALLLPLHLEAGEILSEPPQKADQERVARSIHCRSQGKSGNCCQPELRLRMSRSWAPRPAA